MLLALGVATVMGLDHPCGLLLLHLGHLLLVLTPATTMLVVLLEVVEVVTMILFLVQNAAVVTMARSTRFMAVHDPLGSRGVGRGRCAVVLHAAAGTKVTLAPLVACVQVVDVMAVISLLVEEMTVS